ncbi:MAG: o-succinylbenzoate synthase [Acidobacteria bacterium]|nr:o-succinylbenzoate synthase [Acidobacteriota bacterium]
MRAQKICLRELRMPLLSPFQTSFGISTIRHVMLIEVTVDGVTGWGECVASEDPYYHPETVETAWHIIKDFIWPVVKARDYQSAGEVFDSLEHIRGHNMAKAGVESSLWDAEARLQKMPLWRLLDGRRQEIACGVSIGIKKSLEELEAAVGKEIAAGYQRIKIKIKPGWDERPAEHLRGKWPLIRLMVDANSAYRLADLPLLQRLERFHLMMMEQPLGWDDLFSHAKLQKQLQTPICLDECIHSLEHAQAAIEIGACKIINIKMGRVGGHTVVRRMHDLCQANGIPVWCGGMLESGIGRAHNIALSTLPNFTLPGDVSASKRYFAQDIIEPAVEVTPQGTIRVTENPGIGYEPQLDRIERLTVRKEVLN